MLRLIKFNSLRSFYLHPNPVVREFLVCVLLQLITSEGNRARELTERKTNKGTKRREKKCVFVSCFVHSSLPLQTNTHLFHFVLRSFSYTTRIISEWNERKRTEKNEMNVMEWKGKHGSLLLF